MQDREHVLPLIKVTVSLCTSCQLEMHVTLDDLFFTSVLSLNALFILHQELVAPLYLTLLIHNCWQC